MNAAMSDYLWRAGSWPFSATMSMMCTPAGAFQEGWAQNALRLIQDGRVIDLNSRDWKIQLLLEDLQDIAKHNAAILYQNDDPEKRLTLAQLKDYLREECLLS